MIVKDIYFVPTEESEWYYKCWPWEGLPLGTLIQSSNKDHLVPEFSFTPVYYPRLGLNTWKDIVNLINHYPGKVVDDKDNELLRTFFLKASEEILKEPDLEREEALELEFKKELEKDSSNFQELFHVMMEHNRELLSDLVQEYEESKI